MASFIQNILWDSVSGFVEAGTRTAGGYAGDALIKAGDLVENGGRGLGSSIERKATGLGSSISGQTYKPSAAPLPSSARRPAAHRSNSLPANAKPAKGGSGVPLGAKKTETAAAGTVKKGVGNAAKSGVSMARSTTGSVLSVANRTAGSATKPLSTAKPTNALPKAYPPPSTLPKPSYPSEKKTAVRPEKSKPFVLPKEDQERGKGRGKAGVYPGTSTVLGQGGRTPVKKYKGMERMGGTARRGEVRHLAI